MSNATLVAHVDCTATTVEALGTLPTPIGTRTYRPVAHYDLARRVLDGLAARNVDVVRESYAVGGKDDAKLYAALDLRIPGFDSPDLAFALAYRHANDKTSAIHLMPAATVFVCDNSAFSGADDGIKIKRAHTSRLDLDGFVAEGLDKYLQGIGHWSRRIDDMKNDCVSDEAAKATIFDAIRGRVLPLRGLDEVARLYWQDEAQNAMHGEYRGTLWGLNNAFTEAAKMMGNGQAFHQASARIGDLFAAKVARKKEISAAASYVI